MEYTPKHQEFIKKIKDKIKDAKANPRTVPTEFHNYIRLLTDYIPPPWMQKAEIREKIEEAKHYNKFLFVLAFSSDMSLRSNNIFNINDKRLPNILYALTEIKDIHLFISVSSFFPQSNSDGKATVRRTIKQASRTNVLIADIDCYNSTRCKDLTPEETLALIKKEKPQFFKEDVPLTVVKSGNGLQLYLNIASTDIISKRHKNFWRVLNQRFNEFFTEYGSDTKCSKDITRIFRLPFSTNCKKGKSIPVKLLSDVKNTPIDIDKLAKIMNLTNEDFICRDDELMKKKRIDEKHMKAEAIASRKEQEKIDNRKKHLEYLEWTKTASKEEIDQMNEWKSNGKKGIETLIKRRLDDLWTFLEMRDGDIEGCRNNFLFIFGSTHYRYYSDIDDTTKKLYEINRFFSEPIPESELEATIKSILKLPYTKFTNEYIMSVLQITEEESKELSLCYTKEQRKEHLSNKAKARYRKRLPEGSLTLTEKGKINYDMVAKHMDMPAGELAKMLNLSKSHIYRIKRKVRENQLAP